MVKPEPRGEKKKKMPTSKINRKQTQYCDTS